MGNGESELVQRTASGDQEAFTLLVQAHFNSISNYVMRMMANHPEADDLVQETFTRLWTRAESFNPEKAKLTTWLHQIAYNLCIDQLRKDPRFTHEVTEPTDDTGPDHHLSNNESRQQIHQAMMQLPETQRSAIIMNYYQGLSNREVGDILDLSVSAVESLLARGRKKLRDQLE